jgi:formate dehydrogenase maturation protein FdhE
MEPMTQKEFLDTAASRCPFCRSTDICGEEFDFEGGARKVVCNTCAKMWREVWQITGYEPIE